MYQVMKKYFFKLVGIIAFVSIISMNLNLNSQGSSKNSEITLENIEALSSGEIIIGPLCWQNSTQLCYADYSSGFFVLGTRVG